MKKDIATRKKNHINKQIFYFIAGLYIFIIAGGIITVVSPSWLKAISSEGRKGEAIMYVNYGDNYLNKANYEMAIVQYKKALEINPDIQEAYSNMSVAYNKLNDLKRALQFSEKALGYDDKPLYATYFNIAEVYRKNKQENKAIKYFLKAAKIASFPIHSYHKAGESLNNTKKWAEAKQAFDKAIENKYTMENCYLGMLKRDLKLFPQDDARREIKKQLKQGIGNIDLQNFDETAFNEALLCDGELAGIYNQYGYTFAMQGNMAKAAEYFKLSLKMKPDFEEAKKNLRLAKSKIR
ncbi:MAG: tetratricopeptide repeat protein [Bacteroidota bacterium]|nr:tetratricopeptide repeat protein [Bacteroidota bacterium]